MVHNRTVWQTVQVEKYPEKLHNVCAKHYILSEHLELNELTVLLKDTLNFR
jgi:hypothetical protein